MGIIDTLLGGSIRMAYYCRMARITGPDCAVINVQFNKYTQTQTI